MDAVLRNTTTELRGFLRQVQLISQHPSAVENSISLLELYKMFLNKEKILFTTMNKLKEGDKLTMGFCWIPKCQQAESFRKIESIKEKNHNIEVPTFKLVSDHTVKPPTMFKNNEFTIVFQEIVNTYGVPSYKEANPAVFTIVTFPFQYGIMFGDIGHGLVVLCVGIVLCLANTFLGRFLP